jgi:histidinol dehydrogenase
MAGADRVFSLGGAGAIAALAYGTESVARVDRIVGPGNAYVAEAKLLVASAVAIDSPAGPSELLVIADESADPQLVAREMLAQAEHDPLAAVVAVMSSEASANAVVRAIGQQLPGHPRAAIAATALQGQSAVLWSNHWSRPSRFRMHMRPDISTRSFVAR